MSTYSQIYVHIIFAVKGRESLILPSWESRLYKYVTGIVQNMNQKMIAVNGISNHIHILIGMRPTCCLSDLVREVKKIIEHLHQRKQIFEIEIQLAGGIWRLFLQSQSIGPGSSLRHESKGTSRPQNFQRRIPWTNGGTSYSRWWRLYKEVA